MTNTTTTTTTTTTNTNNNNDNNNNANNYYLNCKLFFWMCNVLILLHLHFLCFLQWFLILTEGVYLKISSMFLLFNLGFFGCQSYKSNIPAVISMPTLVYPKFIIFIMFLISSTKNYYYQHYYYYHYYYYWKINSSWHNLTKLWHNFKYKRQITVVI